MSEVVFEPPVLDLGCGDGMFGSILFGNRPEGINCGIDLCLEDARKAKRTKTYKSLQVADIQELPFSDNSIGSIFSNSVFEHLDDIDMALREAVRVLRPGGKLVVTSPNDRLVDNFFLSGLLHSMGFSRAARAVGTFGNKALGNRTCLSPEAWQEKAVSAGFSTVDCHNIVPPKTFHISELFIPFAVLSVLLRGLFGRLLFFERRLTLKPLHFWLHRYYESNGSHEGLASVIICAK